jgi:hypothetical protein
MSGMKIVLAVAAILGFSFALAPRASAQTQNASIEFVAQVTPSDGLQEPVRGFPFFVLSKSFADIRKEASASYPKPDMDTFIDKLDVSPELKTWMKKNHVIQLAGEEFIHKLNSDTIMGIPEFKSAYIQLNAGTQSVDFPKPKYNGTDQQKNPARYKKLLDEYNAAVHLYIEQHPDSVEGVDLELTAVDPNAKWDAMTGARTTAIRQRTMDLAQSNYTIARVETNLDGKGAVRGLAPGSYWLSTLDVPAIVGDARPRWDMPVTVRAGETKYIALSNANSVRADAQLTQ